MVAVLKWQQSTAGSSGSPSFADVSGPKLRYKSANDNTDDTTDPLVRPSAGTNYSWEKATQIEVESGTFTTLSDLRTLLNKVDPVATGVSVYYGFRTNTAGYEVPIGTASTYATTLLSNVEIAWNNEVDHTSGTGVPWNSADILYLQVQIINTASGGEIADWEHIARYDEV
jgi:hypothetical protein